MFCENLSSFWKSGKNAPDESWVGFEENLRVKTLSAGVVNTSIFKKINLLWMLLWKQNACSDILLLVCDHHYVHNSGLQWILGIVGPFVDQFLLMKFLIFKSINLSNQMLGNIGLHSLNTRLRHWRKSIKELRWHHSHCSQPSEPLQIM